MHLRFMLHLYKIQLEGGRHFLHEHPASARSWKDPVMTSMLKDPRIGTVVSDQCMYGLVTPGPDGCPTPAKKPTRWASSSQPMLDRLSKRCDHSHVHQPLMSGRAAAAAYYPAGLVTNILRGMRDTADLSWRSSEETDARLNSAMAHAGKLQDMPVFNLAATMSEIDANDQ